MNKPKVGVIGCGFVGSAVVRGFNLFADVKAYDVDPKRYVNSIEDVLLSSEFIFICLPTPMETAEGGKCDLKYIEKFFDNLKNFSINENAIFIIKSTVPVGTTARLSKLHPNLKIVHSPEFLTARSASLDFITPGRNIVGAEDPIIGKKVIELYRYRFPGSPAILMKSQESECVKYFCNCFFMTKVLVFNEFRLLTNKLGLNWDTIMEGVLTDGRIAKSHYQVPGWDGKWGAGGTCFPKDINALITTFCDLGLDPKVLEAVWKQNKAVRPREDWDWETSGSAVSHPKPFQET